MKKTTYLILSISLLLLLTGCNDEKVMTCTRENTYNGLTSGTEYKVTYKNDTVTHVTITYNYNQKEYTDGVNTGTDGTTSDNTTNTDNNGIVDGVVGDTVDDIIGGVYNTILDLSGIKDRHTNQINNTNIKGFTSKIEYNTNNSYKVMYDLDLTTINDTDIKRFNVDRSYTKIKDTYSNQGLTCKES